MFPWRQFGKYRRSLTSRLSALSKIRIQSSVLIQSQLSTLSTSVPEIPALWPIFAKLAVIESCELVSMIYFRVNLNNQLLVIDGSD